MASRSRTILVSLIAIAGLALAAGCIGDLDVHGGVVVTSQPLADAFHVLDAEDRLAGVPSWTIHEAPPEAERVGRPFVIDAEEIVALGPRLVLDHPHPLFSGPSRDALATGLDQAGIEHREVPTEPRLSTVEAVLAEAAAAVGEDHEAAWEQIQADLQEVNATLEDRPRPDAVFLFPSSLVAGADTDADLLLRLAGMDNAAADQDLVGYAPVSAEAIQRSGVDLVVATATMRTTPAEIADRPMFEGTRIEGEPQRVLVVDPSTTTRLGPHVADAAAMLAAWAHPHAFEGPLVSPSIDPGKAKACGTITVGADAPNATVHLLGEQHPPGEIRVPEVPDGHYRVTVTGEDATGTSSMDTVLTVEGSRCG